MAALIFVNLVSSVNVYEPSLFFFRLKFLNSILCNFRYLLIVSEVNIKNSYNILYCLNVENHRIFDLIYIQQQ